MFDTKDAFVSIFMKSLIEKRFVFLFKTQNIDKNVAKNRFVNNILIFGGVLRINT